MTTALKSRVEEFGSAARATVRRRSGGMCEARIVCSGAEATHLHHRQLRRGGDHRAVNALHVCSLCHDAIHRNPAIAYATGAMVSQTNDPAEVPWQGSVAWQELAARPRVPR